MPLRGYESSTGRFVKNLGVFHQGELQPLLCICACRDVSAVCRSWTQNTGFGLSLGLNESSVLQSSAQDSENATAAVIEQVFVQCWGKYQIFPKICELLQNTLNAQTKF